MNNLQEAADHNFDKCTSAQSFAKDILKNIVGRAVFQPYFKPCPHGSVYFEILWLIVVTKFATVMSF